MSTENSEMTALVVNCSRNGLGVIRSLGKEKVKIIAVDHVKNSGLYSKYVSKKYILDKIADEGDVFVEEIIRIAKENIAEDKIFLIPTNDIYVDVFSRRWESLKPYFYPIFETDMSVLFANINKTAMYKMAERSGIDYPKTFYALDEVGEEYFPVIIKPDQKRADDAAKNVFRIVKCKSKEELAKPIEKLKKLGIAFVIQQFIPGGDEELYTAGVFLNKGELKAISCGRKLRQFPPQLGQCSFGELVDVPDLEDIVRSFAKESKVTGICQVEFKHHQGKYYLMEINPRSWSWNSLIDYSGVNLPYIACMDMKYGSVEKTVRQKLTKGTWMFTEQDLFHNVIANKNIGFFRFLKDFIRADNYAHFSIGDPLPYLFFLFQTLQIIRKR